MGQLVKIRTWPVLLFAAVLAACDSLPPTGLTVMPSRTAGSAPQGAALPEEAILILAPGSGSRLVGQVHVEGIADSTFEQTLIVQIVLLPGAGGDGVDQTEQVLAQQ